ncbi:MAG: type II toxin-antitoxin system VapC family toxin [Candidatus Sumerlaeia bacterium]|nr:type II toxin-antitoxin system VapC family toxin [Candidatus Sumerlaeia bacterium]
MKLLFDAHAFLWWVSEHEKMSSRALGLCKSGENTLAVSVVSIWEIVIKTQLGKMVLDMPLDQIVAHEVQANGILVLPVFLSHIYELRDLPPYHRDPFDRLLVAQARAEGYSIVSADSVLQRYPVEIIW